MPMPNHPVPPLNMELRADEPATLEVMIDPAAHGPAGLGPIKRRVLLTTANGQTIPFDLTAMVVE